jgi:hypothetical protein
MKRDPVDSSSVAEAGYDGERRVMEVLFRSGGLYRYLDVPAAIWAGFEAAESKGRFVNLRVKPDFDCVRVRRAPR